MGMFHSLQVLKQIRDNFFDELVNASKGKRTSLAFIKNPLPRHSIINDGEQFQVMVIGGTNFESALVMKHTDNVEIRNTTRMPFSTFETTDDFLSFLNARHNKQMKTLAINFAFPIKPVLREGHLDGFYIGTSQKQPGLVGLKDKVVGEEIEKYFITHNGAVSVAIGHDLMCLALAALPMESRQSLACGIVGTGVNFGFFLDSATWINSEAGDFDKFSQSETGAVIDKRSGRP